MTVTQVARSSSIVSDFRTRAAPKEKVWPSSLTWDGEIRWPLMGFFFETLTVSYLLKRLYASGVRPDFHTSRVLKELKNYKSLRRYIQGNKKETNRRKLLKELFKTRFKTKPTPEELKLAERLVLHKKSLKKLSRDLSLQMGVGYAGLRGKVDVYDRKKGWVVDIKLLHPPRVDASVALQLHLYRMMIEKSGRPVKKTFLFLEGVGLKRVRIRKKYPATRPMNLYRKKHGPRKPR